MFCQAKCEYPSFISEDQGERSCLKARLKAH